MKFRKKLIVIEAMQYSRESCRAVCAWVGIGHHGYLLMGCGSESLSIPTLEGVHEARPDDWIIKGIKGEFYPCKPDIFEATYEPVESDTDEENPQTLGDA